MLTTEEFDFLLVRQKDYILNLIHKRRFIEARCCLATVSELWESNTYGYKLQELSEIIRINAGKKGSED